jgi:hypothetical protein
MTSKQRISDFVSLGQMIGDYLHHRKSSFFPEQEWIQCSRRMEDAVIAARKENPWFTLLNIREALRFWSDQLTRKNLGSWLKPYTKALETNRISRKIGIIMAGNLPLVGFHDLLSILISGHHAVIKCASQDQQLIPVLIQWLLMINPDWKTFITISNKALGPVDAVIATGSNNSARYFAHYFGKQPHIIRKNRNGVAVLTGKESFQSLSLIAQDIFSYFGLGCRNITMIYVPENYDFTSLIKAMMPYRFLWYHTPYRNNYEYHKSLYLVNRTPLIDGGFYVLIPSDKYTNPVSVIHYAPYKDLAVLKQELLLRGGEIQCIVSDEPFMDKITLPGQTQSPALNDYADGVDTLHFLLEKIG